MNHLYDQNIVKLKEEDQNYVTAVRDSAK